MTSRLLDHDDCIAGVDQALQHFDQPCGVGEMQARRGLIQDVERAAGGALAQLRRQLDPLRLAA